MLCAGITPTRNGVAKLTDMLSSYFSTADNPNNVEVVLRIDDDNAATIKALPTLKTYFPNVRWVIGPRGQGYSDMYKFAMEASAVTDATWLFLIDDDAVMLTRGWDTLLSKVPTQHCAAQPEFYWLGFSKYGSGSCGPVALFVPNKFWITLGCPTIGMPVDQWWLDLLRHHQWPIHLLPGVIYHHRHDPNSEHRK
jgi:hypothetical protein